MKIERVVTSISWIPSEAIKGALKVPFEVGMAHYDDPLPDVIHDLESLRAADKFRFANELRAWIEIEDSSEGWGGPAASPLRGRSSRPIPGRARRALASRTGAHRRRRRRVSAPGGRPAPAAPRPG